MAALVFNNASATLANPLPATGVGSNTIQLLPGQGQLFPSPAPPDFFFATLVNMANAIEVVICTARNVDTLTVTRAADGTIAQSWLANDRLELRPCAGLFNNKLNTDTGGTIGSSNQAGQLTISGPSGVVRPVFFNTGTNPRWGAWANGTTEGAPGSNVGSDFVIARYNDSGGFIDPTLIITRSNGAVTLNHSLTVNGSTNFQGAINAPAASIPVSAVNITAGSVPFSALGAPSQSLATNGFVTLPGGLILQWGHFPGPVTQSTNYTVVFQQKFPTNLFSAVATLYLGSTFGSPAQSIATNGTPTTSQVVFVVQGSGGPNLGTAAGGFAWVAIGN